MGEDGEEARRKKENKEERGQLREGISAFQYL